MKPNSLSRRILVLALRIAVAPSLFSLLFMPTLLH
jgi:hypothetical protein